MALENILELGSLGPYTFWNYYFGPFVYKINQPDPINTYTQKPSPNTTKAHPYPACYLIANPIHQKYYPNQTPPIPGQQS